MHTVTILSLACFVFVLLAAPSLCFAASPGGERDAEPPSLPSEKGDGYMLGMAGAPVGLFGSTEQPRFEEVFTDLSQNGFNVFFPSFITQENSEGVESAGFDQFFYGAQPPVSEYPESKLSPYRAAKGKLKIVFPAFVLVSQDEWCGEIDPRELRSRLEQFKHSFLGDDISVLAGFQNFDEPSNAYIVADYEKRPKIQLANLHLMKSVLKDVFGPLPVLVVEAPVPFVITLDPAVKPFEGLFWQGVAETVGAGDWYGFDLYPVGVSEDLAVVGRHVRMAAEHAPDKKIISVLQGFGRDDLGAGGRRPNANETRFMAYDSIINGADGLFWWGASAMQIDEDPGLWDALKAVGRELRTLSPVLNLPGSRVKASDERIECLARKGTNATYLITANTTDESLSFTLPLGAYAGTDAETYRVWDQIAKALISSGSCAPDTVLHDSLPGFGVRVYTVTFR